MGFGHPLLAKPAVPGALQRDVLLQPKLGDQLLEARLQGSIANNIESETGMFLSDAGDRADGVFDALFFDQTSYRKNAHRIMGLADAVTKAKLVHVQAHVKVMDAFRGA